MSTEKHISYWRDSVELPSFPSLTEDLDTEVCIIGGGITGIVTAYLLSKEGKKVTLLEADTLLNGTTGYTTAKVTAQHGLIYDEIIQHMGLEKAKLYYQANTEAIQFVEGTVKELQIDCDLENEDAYLYATSEEYARKIHKEYEAYQSIGIPSNLDTTIPFPIETTTVLKMKEQKQFHPLRFLHKLINEMVQNGVAIYEHTPAKDIIEETRPVVVTKSDKHIRCNHVVIASHFPFYDLKGFYFTRMYAERSYVLAVKPNEPFPGGMYYSVDSPTRSMRSVQIKGETYVLVGGESHKTGQEEETDIYYNALIDFSEKVLSSNKYDYQWSAQDLTTLDKLPYVGEITKENETILIATGYRKWGMSNGIAASLLLCDIITGKDNPYKELYSPSRVYLDPSIKTFIQTNADVAKHLIKGKLKTTDENRELLVDEAAVFHLNGQKVGCYKDLTGKVHMVDTTCTHLGCEVAWNKAEKTWDCPCHGSRFSYEGEVIEGPALEPLSKISEE